MPSFIPPPAFIDGIGGPEMVMVFLLVLLLFGGKKLPEFAKGLGKSVREFKRAASGVEDEIRRAIDSAPSSDAPPPKPAPRIEPPKATTKAATPATENPEKKRDPYPEDPKDFLS
jgi:sec-independent protein translocase protein TatA